MHNFLFVVVKTGSNIMGLDLFDALGYRIDVTYHNADVCHSCSTNRLGVYSVSVISEQELVNATSSDVILCQIIKLVQNGWLNKDELDDEYKPYYSEQNVLSMLNGSLVHNDVVIIPTTLRDKMVSLAHKGHPRCCSYVTAAS